MPIITDFSFAHLPAPIRGPIKVGPTLPDLLGLLRGFVGATTAGQPATWKGTGFNMIWRPNSQTSNPTSGPEDFFLQLNMTSETLSFTDITGTGIADRGHQPQSDIALGGLAYQQAIKDSFDMTGQHFETGIWVTVPASTTPAESASVTRMGSIPHGTTINLEGTALTTTKPQFATSSIVPFAVGSPDDGQSGLSPFPTVQTLATPSPSRTPNSRVASLQQSHLNNPNLFLSDAIAGQTITKTTVIQVTSDHSAKGSVPDAGGGVASIAFLSGGKSGGGNANIPTVSATFWIEEVTDAHGKTFTQLQYTQRVLLTFVGLNWPHVTVGTLTLS